MSSDPAPPYRSGLAAGAGLALIAGLIVALADVVHTGEGALAVLGLWALVALPIAAFFGVVLGAGNATWGTGWVRRAFARLRTDDALDQKVTALVIASLVVGGGFVIVVQQAAVGLVGDVQRKAVGGLLLGGVVLASLPVFALAVLPVYRVVAKVLGVLPMPAPLLRLIHALLGSRVVTFVVVAPLAVGGVAFLYVRKSLDLEALNLGPILAVAAIVPIAMALGLVFYGPLAAVRERLPARGILVAVGLLVAIALPVVGLRGTPTEDTAFAITQRSWAGSKLVPKLRKLIDADKDGYSAFFRGDDCDDTSADIHPNATDLPANGIDEDCFNGDAKRQVLPPRIPDGAGSGAGSAVANGAGSGSAPPPPMPGTAGGNVLVIFVDTLRADRMGYMGYQRDGKSLTPNLDALAASSVVFERAFSQAPNTPRSVPSFMTSRYPSQVKYDKQFKSYPKVLDENETLFEQLSGAGYTTIGETSHFYFCDRVKYPDSCKPVVSWMASNITQGATEWDNSGAENIPESNKDIAGPRTIEKANKKLEDLANSKTKFAMLVHLFEPHSTYMTHAGRPITESGTKSLEQKYDYEIEFMDGMVGKLLAQLAATGLDKSTTIVVLGDHGEAFGAHVVAGKSDFFHGDSLYAELVHVPLIVKVPGGKSCRRKDTVGLVDFAPTVTALVGVPAAASWQGRSLVPAVQCGELAPAATYSELLRAPDWDHEAKSMITADGFHVYFRKSDSRWEVYDLNTDPGEKTNIAKDHPKLEQWKSELAAWMEGPLAAGGGK